MGLDRLAFLGDRPVLHVREEASSPIASARRRPLGSDAGDGRMVLLMDVRCGVRGCAIHTWNRVGS